MKQRQHYLALILAISLVSSACGQLEFDIVEPTVEPAKTTNLELNGETKTVDDGIDLAADPTEQVELDLCSTASPESVESFACILQEYLIARNSSALLAIMSNPFSIGYWGSEGRSATPQSILLDLFGSYLPSDSSSQLTFTTDRSLFPALQGIPVDGLFGPDLNIAMIIYSEGWGEDAAGAALLYIVETDSGEFAWQAIAVAPNHFEM